MPSGGFPLAAPQAHAGERVIKQVFDGDLRIDRISGNCEVILESRHGSIIVADQVGEYAHVSLKAAKDVIIDRGIGRHSLVQIVSGGDVVVGQQIGENSQLAITSTGGQIGNGPAERGRSTTRPNAETTVHIGGDICQHSSAKITAQNDVTIDGGIRQHANLDIISLHGTIIIGHGIGESAVALVTAGRAVRVG
ncbi:MAG: hypothetical protein JO166_06360, partial [Deltaproteobacteria bacterium]|nr:hypothetical protein [Deltaproteobacteria bacterium]